MNRIKHHLLAVMLLAAYGVPATVSAETASLAAVTSAPTDASEAVDAAPADRMKLEQEVPASKFEMMQAMDPTKCKLLMEAQAKDRRAQQPIGPAGGRTMMMGPGAGMMRPDMGRDGHPDCMMQGRDRFRQIMLDEQRLEALETRMDMMQMMLRMMLGH